VTWLDQLLSSLPSQKNKKEVIKMPDDERRDTVVSQHPMAKARETITKQLETLDTRLKALRAERNAVARALRGLGKFY